MHREEFEQAVAMDRSARVSGLAGKTYDPLDAAKAAYRAHQCEVATRGRTAMPIEASIKRLRGLAGMIGDVSSTIEAVVDRAHGNPGSCGSEGEPDRAEPVTLAERLEHAVDSLDRRVCELMQQADRARSIA